MEDHAANERMCWTYSLNGCSDNGNFCKPNYCFAMHAPDLSFSLCSCHSFQVAHALLGLSPFAAALTGDMT
jgi:hypothetical protein